MNRQIDPSSPVPLYHQIAVSIRARIEAGELGPGDALAPLREAAKQWGVHLHTVRHAYAALARNGLVETTGTRGTRVASCSPQARVDTPPRQESEATYISRMVRKAAAEYGLSSSELASAIQQHADVGPDRPIVYVVECSDWQACCHARELIGQWDVDARPWSLELPDEPPPGQMVGTYFHVNDIRRRWPHRLREMRFLTIGVDERLAHELPNPEVPGKRITIRLCERDEPTAEIVCADLSVVLDRGKYHLEPYITTRPNEALQDPGESTIVMFTPRVWSELDESARTNPRAVEARYIFSRDDLSTLGNELGWRPATGNKNRAAVGSTT